MKKNKVTLITKNNLQFLLLRQTISFLFFLILSISLFSQTNSKELDLIATSNNYTPNAFTLLRNKAFFTGYQGEVFIVGSTPYSLNGNYEPCFDVVHYSPIIQNNYYFCAKRTSGWGNKSFYPDIGGLKYRRDDSYKKYCLNRSSLKKTPKVIEFLEDQNQKYNDFRLQLSDQNNFAIGYSLNIPHQLLVYNFSEEGYNEKKIRIISNKKGYFQDIQISKNGKYAIVIFSNLTLFYEYKNGELIKKCTIDRGIPNGPFVKNLKTGSFTSISNSGIISFHYPNEKVYRYSCNGKIDSIDYPYPNSESLFISGVSSTGDTIAFVCPMGKIDSSQIILYDLQRDIYFGKTKMKGNTPKMVLFNKNKSIIIFKQKGWVEYGFSKNKNRKNSINELTQNNRRITFEKYFFDQEKNIIYNYSENFLLKNIKSVNIFNSYGDFIINTLSEGSFLYNIDARVQVSDTYDTMWVDQFSKVILTKKNDKFGFIFDNHYSKEYTETMTPFKLTNSLGADQYKVFYLQYTNGEKLGVTDLSLNPLLELDTDSLIIKTSGNDRILFFRKKNLSFQPYNIESNKKLPYAYKSFSNLIKRDTRLLKVVGEKGFGVFSLKDRDEMIPSKYDTLIYPSISRYFIIASQENLIDVYQRNDLLLKFSDQGIDLNSINYHQSYDFEKFSYYKHDEGYFIFGLNHNANRNSYFKAGPFDEIISLSNLSTPHSISFNDPATPVAKVKVKNKKYLLLENKKLIPFD